MGMRKNDVESSDWLFLGFEIWRASNNQLISDATRISVELRHRYGIFGSILWRLSSAVSIGLITFYLFMTAVAG